MRNNFLFILFLACGIALALSSCTTEAYEASGPPLPPTPIVTDTVINPNTYSIAGQTWVIDRYRIGQIGEINLTSDTIFFDINGAMQFNDVDANYVFYPSTFVYVLTLYQSPWGIISGSINPYNLESGEMPGLPFSDIASGSDGLQVYLWMRRI
jgi:hypothetical protein